MNRSDKIEVLAKVFEATGITPAIAAGMSKDILDELFPPLEPIEYDKLHTARAYIPLPGGFEVQTKGQGSTFRIVDDKDDSMPITDSRYGYEVIEALARSVRKAYGE